MSKVELFKKEITKTIDKNPKKEGKGDAKILLQELINRLDTYEEKVELIKHYEDCVPMIK